jgi:hypothetical protein
VAWESLGISAGSTSTAVGSRGPTDCAVQHDAPLVVVLVRDRAMEGISSEAYEIPRFVRCQPVDLGSQTDAPAVRTVARKR